MPYWSKIGYYLGIWVAFSLTLGGLYLLLHKVCHWAADRWRKRKQRRETKNA